MTFKIIQDLYSILSDHSSIPSSEFLLLFTLIQPHWITPYSLNTQKYACLSICFDYSFFLSCPSYRYLLKWLTLSNIWSKITFSMKYNPMGNFHFSLFQHNLSPFCFMLLHCTYHIQPLYIMYLFIYSFIFTVCLSPLE